MKIRCNRAAETGAVTAETAVTLPLLVVFTLGLVWLVTLGVTHLRTVDAAREVARVAARGDETSQAIKLGRMVAPPGASFSVRQTTGTIVVHVKAPVRGPIGIFQFLPTFTVSATSVAAAEPTS